MSNIVLDIDKANASLVDAAVTLFAEMAFMDAQTRVAEEKEDLAIKDADAVHVALDVLMPLSCRFELVISRALADQISDTLYGEDPMEFTSSTGKVNRNRDDSALEMLNVLAGSFLSNYFGPGTPFKLELPFFIFGEADVTGPVLSRIELDVEGAPAEVMVRSIRYRY